MKMNKLFLTGALVVAVVGSAFAFSAKKFSVVYCTAPSSETCTATTVTGKIVSAPNGTLRWAAVKGSADCTTLSCTSQLRIGNE